MKLLTKAVNNKKIYESFKNFKLKKLFVYCKFLKKSFHFKEILYTGIISQSLMCFFIVNKNHECCDENTEKKNQNFNNKSDKKKKKSFIFLL